MARTPAIRYGTVMDIAMTLATGPLAPLLRDGDLPGPMNLNRLADFGTLCKLDSANAYTLQDSTTLYGRATIVATVMPRNAVACGFTAAWLWLGGLFPETIDILSSSHFRTLRHGRKVRVFNRKAPPGPCHSGRSGTHDHAGTHRLRSGVDRHRRDERRHA